MDPVSIVSLVCSALKLAGSVGTQVAQFVDDTKHTNQFVGDLSLEIYGIEIVLKNMEKLLNSSFLLDAEQHARSEESHELWALIRGAVADNNTVLRRVEAIVMSLIPDKPNFALQAVRQLKLNYKQAEINKLIAQLRSQKGTLQLSLQMINVRATYLAPGAVISDLAPQIDELRYLLERSLKLDEMAVGIGVRPGKFRPESLRRSAERIMSSASSCSGGSEASCSAVGGDMARIHRQSTLDWIYENPPPYAIPSHLPAASNMQMSQHSDAVVEFRTRPSHSFHLPDTINTIDNAEGTSEDDPDDEDHLHAEVVDALLQKGDKHMRAKQFLEAQKKYERALQRAKDLPLRVRNVRQLSQAQLNLAICLFHSPDWRQAEEPLFALTLDRTLPRSKGERGAHVVELENELALLKCHAADLLSRLYYRQKEYPAARSYCDKAMVGLRRMGRKSHTTYFELLYLMHQILSAQGCHADAEVYLDWIPADRLQDLGPKLNDEFADDNIGGPGLGSHDVPSMANNFKLRHAGTTIVPLQQTAHEDIQISHLRELSAPNLEWPLHPSSDSGFPKSHLSSVIYKPTVGIQDLDAVSQTNGLAEFSPQASASREFREDMLPALTQESRSRNTSLQCSPAMTEDSTQSIEPPSMRMPPPALASWSNSSTSGSPRVRHTSFSKFWRRRSSAASNEFGDTTVLYHSSANSDADNSPKLSAASAASQVSPDVWARSKEVQRPQSASKVQQGVSSLSTGVNDSSQRKSSWQSFLQEKWIEEMSSKGESSGGRGIVF